MNTLTSSPDTLSHYLEPFDAIEKDGLYSRREEAFDHFKKNGFPKFKDEEWKHTDVSFFSKEVFALPGVSKISFDPSVFPLPSDAIRIVFLNGEFSKRDSSLMGLPADAVVCSMPEARMEHPELVERYFSKNSFIENGFSALNAALALDGLFVYFPTKCECNIPIYVFQVSGGFQSKTIVQTRNLIIADGSSNFSLVEISISADESPVFINSVSEVIVAANAQVDHYALKNINHKSIQIDTVSANQQADSRFSSYSFTLDGKLVRNNLNIKLEGKNGHAEMYGLFLSNAQDHFDNHTMVDHAVPHCLSNQLYKGIADENSSAVFNGKIIVRKDAQKTNAFQSNKNLLLSEGASMNSKPQLEIFADDVKCSHGATTGQLDSESLFYLRSRGIGESQARRMLVSAFAQDVVEKVSPEPLKNYLKKLLAERLT